LTNLAAAILASDEQKSIDPIQNIASDTAREGHFDAIVLAYRVRPDMLPGLVNVIGESDLLVLIERARDQHLATRMGLPTRPSARFRDAMLSPREREVGALLAQGHTNAEIARALFISEVTVKVHVRHILAKLGARNRAEAAVLVATQPSAD
jgi:DNA-binding NarL/FixJ family response regulator